ncbi:MAG: sigma 54-interacting transcriptional regulator [Cyclobacteriaceae bacterium]|nr:sigma 54-interacting transcriptional regulator [Cyclobacteriaceae bacterium]
MERINAGSFVKLIIVGAGKGGKALLEQLNNDPSIQILGIADVELQSQGISLAKDLGVPFSNNFIDLIEKHENEVDIIIDVTGNPDVQKQLSALKPPQSRMIVGIAAKFIWELLESRDNNRRLKERFEALNEEMRVRERQHVIFGSNPLMQEVEEMANQVAPTPSTVLITGETGTGKEIIAQSIHEQSQLKDKPFLKVNCTAFSPELLDSELFGHVKGAFTGAMANKIGILEKANNGTLFLDEIGDVSMEMQVKLLRYLQFGEVRPVGSTETKVVSTRIITATNRNLQKLIEEGRFREDLFYRLNTFTLELPPLRNRKEDIPLFAYHFLKKAVLKINKIVNVITPKALEHLSEYGWPGNLRELQSVIERAVILTKTTQVDKEHLPLSIQSVETGFDFNSSLLKAKEKAMEVFERQAIQHYLVKAKGNISLACAYAKVSRRTFYRIMDKHRIEARAFKK